MDKIKRFFINSRGEIRLGWLLLIAAGLYAAATVGVYLLYWNGYETMMNIWCVTSENIARAPGWVQFLYSWSNVIVQLLQGGLLILFAAGLARAAHTEKKKAGRKGFLKGAGWGAGSIAAIWCILMLMGSVRLGWRISRPELSVNAAALLLTTSVSALAEGCFFYGSVYGMIKKRLPMWAALAGMAVLNVLMMGSLHPAAAVNAMLWALVCCGFCEQYGMGAAVGFCFAWSYLEQAVFGFAGAAAALYETYPVNLYWLNGGNSGVMSGVITTAALLAVLVETNRKVGIIRLPKIRKKSKSPS